MQLKMRNLYAKEGREVTLRVAKGHQSLFTPTTMTRIETALSQLLSKPSENHSKQ